MRALLRQANRTRLLIVGGLLILVGAATVSAALATSALTTSPAPKITFKTPGFPSDVSVGLGSVWVGSHRAGFLYRINSRTRKVVAISMPDDSCGAAAISDSAVWAPGCNGILKIDPKTDRVVGRAIGGGPVLGAGSLWTSSLTTCRLFRLDPRSGVVLARINSGIPPGTGSSGDGCGPLGVDYGSVWVYSDTAVSRIDPRTNKLTRIIPLPGGKAGGDYLGGYLFGGFATFAGGKVWLTNPAGVYEIDPTTNTATRLPIRIKPFSLGNEPEITSGAGSVWFRTNDHTIARINPATGNLIATYPGHGGAGLAYAFGSLWLANGDLDTTWREPIH